MAKRLAVVLSQGASHNPVKRRLEEDLVAALVMEPGLDVTIVPGLYDLKTEGTGVLALSAIAGPLVLISWHYERAARWVLSRHGIDGQVGTTLLASEDDADDETETKNAAEVKPRVQDDRVIPARRIYCLDLKAAPTATAFVEEIRRIKRETLTPLVQLGGLTASPGQTNGSARAAHPSESNGSTPHGHSGNGHAGNGHAGNGHAENGHIGHDLSGHGHATNGHSGNGHRSDGPTPDGRDGDETAPPKTPNDRPTGPLISWSLLAEETEAALTTASRPAVPPATGAMSEADASPSAGTPGGAANSPSDIEADAPARLITIEEKPSRRWYPVIDYSRCTNCMECIDFCLFGVYGVDRAETILVEQPDNCRKGCPACSRVCPENAIIFPQHKTPAIAGAAAEAESFKIDLSQLFGAADAIDVAARERDEHLLLAGRQAVGTEVGIRRLSKPARERDALDDLVDAIDELEI